MCYRSRFAGASKGAGSFADQETRPDDRGTSATAAPALRCSQARAECVARQGLRLRPSTAVNRKGPSLFLQLAVKSSTASRSLCSDSRGSGPTPLITPTSTSWIDVTHTLHKRPFLSRSHTDLELDSPPLRHLLFRKHILLTERFPFPLPLTERILSKHIFCPALSSAPKLCFTTSVARFWLSPMLYSSLPTGSVCPSTTMELISLLNLSEQTTLTNLGTKALRNFVPWSGITDLPEAKFSS